MPKYQAISDDEKKYTFMVFADDGSSQECVYECLEGENADQMMSRVANHHNDEILKATPPADIVQVSEPIKDAIPQKDLSNIV
jgi:hypothetical protein